MVSIPQANPLIDPGDVLSGIVKPGPDDGHVLVDKLWHFGNIILQPKVEQLPGRPQEQLKLLAVPGRKHGILAIVEQKPRHEESESQENQCEALARDSGM